MTPTQKQKRERINEQLDNAAGVVESVVTHRELMRVLFLVSATVGITLADAVIAYRKRLAEAEK